ncbi:MAG: hypothetical protein GTN70_01880 [Deltaproteobacteria bacterium]|nr:hypothetical protein [Deltaproteobacteria bacterium]NIS76396.1 hypothetical protein [Deltaproteobacteria bacterium]
MNKRVIIYLSIILLLGIYATGCGRKGEPRPLWPDSTVRDTIHIGGY